MTASIELLFSHHKPINDIREYEIKQAMSLLDLTDESRTVQIAPFLFHVERLLRQLTPK